MQYTNNKLFGKVTGNWKNAIKFSSHFGLVGSIKIIFAVIYEKSVFLTNYQF